MNEVQNLQQDLFASEILHIGTGGTISSVKRKGEGISPTYTAEEIYRLVCDKRPKLKRYKVSNFSFRQLDSSNMTYEDRSMLQKYIIEKMTNGNRFLITHGTDTMEETAHYLAFTLLNPERRLFLTGSTFTPETTNTDAYDNFVSGVVVASEAELKGVFIVYNKRVMLGPRTAKINPYSKRAFTSKNFPDVARVYGYAFSAVPNALEKLRSNNENLNFYLGDEPLYLTKPVEGKIGHIELLGKPEPKDLDTEFSTKGNEAVVIEAYGSGGIPDRWLPYIERWMRRGKQIMITSRCDEPLITLDYPMMIKAHRMGVFVAYDMLPRVTVAKALIAYTYLRDKPQAIKTFMHGNICGEINPRIVETYEDKRYSKEEIRDVFSLLRQREDEFRKSEEKKTNGLQRFYEMLSRKVRRLFP